MADKKISALTSATTPLAGTEVLPIVQSGATVKVAVSDLTAGRAVSASSLTAFGTGDLVNIQYSNNAAPAYLKWKQVDGTTLWTVGGGYVERQDELAFSRGATTVLYLDNANNVKVSTGNLVIGTSGKGVSLPGGITWTSGSGSPEGVVTAPVGSLYSRSDGGLLSSLYVKESGSGNTGWVGK